MSKDVKTKVLPVISVCSVCGEPVSATVMDKAYRHGFKRHVVAMPKPKKGFGRRMQEDSTPCAGSGQEVVYKRSSY